MGKQEWTSWYPFTGLVLLQKNCEVAEREKEIFNSNQLKEISLNIISGVIPW